MSHHRKRKNDHRFPIEITPIIVALIGLLGGGYIIYNTNQNTITLATQEPNVRATVYAELTATAHVTDIRSTVIAEIPQTAIPLPSPQLTSSIPSTPINLSPTQCPTTGTGTPLTTHEIYSVGTGVFQNVTHSDGMVAISNTDLSNHPCIDFINTGQQSANGSTKIGCITSRYQTEKIWFGNTGRTTVSVKSFATGAISIIGEFTQAAQMTPVGFIVDYPVEIGDEICIDDPTLAPNAGFHLWLGPDLYYYSDSHCYRGFC